MDNLMADDDAVAIAPESAATGRDATASAELSIVIPCYKERTTFRRWRNAGRALAGIAWEVVFVDDDSPDGTADAVRGLAQRDPRIRCIRRIGRRGLASAVIEGALSSAADYVAVIDGDLQHDETRLPIMLRCAAVGALRHRGRQPPCRGRHQRGPGQCLAPSPVGWRHQAGPDGAAGKAERPHERLLHAAARRVRADRASSDGPGVQDPARHPAVIHDQIARRGNPDALLAAGRRGEQAGPLVLAQFLGLLVDKAWAGSCRSASSPSRWSARSASW